jgi:hypothetical protein
MPRAIETAMSIVRLENPGLPRRGFPFPLPGLGVGDREARADGQYGELIDRIAAGAPVRKLLFVEALGHTRVPFAGDRPDHRAGVELATIDAHRAAEAVADLKRRFDDRVARETRRNRTSPANRGPRVRILLPPPVSLQTPVSAERTSRDRFRPAQRRRAHALLRTLTSIAVFAIKPLNCREGYPARALIVSACRRSRFLLWKANCGGSNGGRPQRVVSFAGYRRFESISKKPPVR